MSAPGDYYASIDEAYAALRDAAECWPHPNKYDLAIDYVMQRLHEAEGAARSLADASEFCPRCREIRPGLIQRWRTE